jgi:hypothetical protein
VPRVRVSIFKLLSSVQRVVVVAWLYLTLRAAN